MKKKKNRLIRFFLYMVMVMAFLSPVLAASQKPSLSRTKLSLYVGKTYVLKAEGFQGKVKWRTSDKKVATVSKAGKITAKSPGTATITAQCGKTKKTCKVTVKAIKLSKKKLSVEIGKKFTLKLYCGASKGIQWSSSNSTVVKITSTSKNTVTLKAQKAGKATVTATYKKKKYKCTVKVKNPATPAISGTVVSPTPVVSSVPTVTPVSPTVKPIETPVRPTEEETDIPSSSPIPLTATPTATPAAAQASPTTKPSVEPTEIPANEPTATPVPVNPADTPAAEPTLDPSPTAMPAFSPTPVIVSDDNNSQVYAGEAFVIP